jgi:magnesium transporter
MSTAQLSDLFAVLPHDDRTELTALLPKDQADKLAAMLSEREATAKLLLSAEFVTMQKETPVGDALRQVRTSGATHSMISYIYIISPLEKLLLGVVDIRDLVLASDQQTLGDLMTSPVVSADESDTREDLADLFAKYHYRMVPVVDAHDHLLGVVHYNDVMKGLVTRAKT